jgi:anti-sigma factor RsiW
MILTFLSCKRTLRVLDDYLDRELSPREMQGVRMHLAICHACEEKFAFQARFVSVLRERLPVLLSLEEQSERMNAARLHEWTRELTAGTVHTGTAQERAPKVVKGGC